MSNDLPHYRITVAVGFQSGTWQSYVVETPLPDFEWRADDDLDLKQLLMQQHPELSDFDNRDMVRIEQADPIAFVTLLECVEEGP